MKNSTIPFLLMLIISLFTVACNKEKGSVTPNVLRKVDKVTISDGTFRNYTYDAQGRCLRIDYKDRYVVLKYGNGTIDENITYYTTPSSPMPTFYVHTLNNNGLVQTSHYILGSSAYYKEYTYNTNGRLTNEKLVLTPGSNIISENIYTYDIDGDLTTFEYRSVASPTSNYIFRYTRDKTHYATTSNEFSGLEWYGKSSLHTASKAVIGRANGTPDATINYPITYDAKGYVLSSINTFSITPSTGVVTILSTANYTYK